MPPLAGFSGNAFQTYEDFKTACISLLRALKPYQSPGGARIRLPLVTGTHFDDVASQLEGFSRPLWAIGTLLHGSCLTTDEYEELVEPYVRGLGNGTDPKHSEYWGPVLVRDQRMVEMEIISFALLVAPDTMFHQQTEQAQVNIREWLSTLNEKDFPVTNWLWFRVMTNLALVKVCGVPYDEVKTYMKDDLDQMENFYLDEGWAADGLWNDNGRQADYYSGSFAIQFSQLLYMKMAAEFDAERCQKFRDRAVLFASSIWQYFDETGAAIPFGRSLTYRFAFAGFWSAVAFAEVELPAPLHDWGIVKGLLLRHFRWWGTKSDLFNIDGTLTIGFTYPNMYMSEDYNSPQSPYWAMKSFIALSLPKEHPFWEADEKPLPVGETRISSGPNHIITRLTKRVQEEQHHWSYQESSVKISTPIRPPSQIVCHSKHHHFLLSSGQFCPWPLKATEAKYGKFAYSSHFGFSVPTGTLIQQIAPDSTLALSKDDGDTWRVPWKLDHHQIETAWLRRGYEVLEELSTLVSTWKPWKDANIEVKTTLAPPCERWPDWHVRAHKIENLGDTDVTIQTVQGGFAIQGREHKLGMVLPSYTGDTKEESSAVFSRKSESGFPEGTRETPTGALICSNAGASGIKTVVFNNSEQRKGEILKPDSNTNLMWQRTLIPIINGTIKVPKRSNAEIVSVVFALGRRTGLESVYDGADIEERWRDVPQIRSFENPVLPSYDFIRLPRNS